MPAAVLLIDLQRDFLDRTRGRMPVDQEGAVAVLAAANAVLAGALLAPASPIFIVNRFPAADRIGNWFRHGAAIDGTAGAELDDRLVTPGDAEVIRKSRPSAFTNPELEPLLRSRQIDELVAIGVFAEGCVRATVLDALQRGFRVRAPADAIASNARWKKRLALWLMCRAGADVAPLSLGAGAAPGAAPRRR